MLEMPTSLWMKCRGSEGHTELTRGMFTGGLDRHREGTVRLSRSHVSEEIEW